MDPTPSNIGEPQPQLDANVREALGKELRAAFAAPANPQMCPQDWTERPALLEFCNRFGPESHIWGFPKGRELGLPRNHLDWRIVWTNWTLNPARYPTMCLAFLAHMLVRNSASPEVRAFLEQHFQEHGPDILMKVMLERLPHLDNVQSKAAVATA